MTLEHRKFVLPEGYNCREFVMRETCGLDEQKAAKLVESRKGSTDVIQEMVRLSIVSVDGEAVLQPFFGLDNWNTKTRQFVLKAYELMNTVPQDDMLSFQMASVVADQTLAATQGE